MNVGVGNFHLQTDFRLLNKMSRKNKLHFKIKLITYLTCPLRATLDENSAQQALLDWYAVHMDVHIDWGPITTRNWCGAQTKLRKSVQLVEIYFLLKI